MYLRETISYLHTLGSGGGTKPGPALKAAIEDPAHGITIVLISDGDDLPMIETTATIDKAQKVRKARGQSPVPIMVWGAGDKAKDQESLKKLAKIGGGGLWVHGKTRAGPF
jgi:CO dehydrogenase/acetyl-CoA synthase delta subunit